MCVHEGYVLVDVGALEGRCTRCPGTGLAGGCEPAATGANKPGTSARAEGVLSH